MYLFQHVYSIIIFYYALFTELIPFVYFYFLLHIDYLPLAKKYTKIRKNLSSLRIIVDT